MTLSRTSIIEAVSGENLGLHGFEKFTVLILLLSLVLTLSCCSDNNAKELFDTAKLEELQFNPDHAKKLYQEIVSKYPESEYAEKAKERLAALKKEK